MSYKQLTEVERYQIYAFLKAGYTQKMIAKELERSPSTISRELKRNKGLRGYRPKQAQTFADGRKESCVHYKVTGSSWENVEKLLREDWSPEQISEWLKAQGLQTISHEWIYQYVLNDKLNGGDLFTHLRCKKKRKKRYGATDDRGQIKNRVTIDERPSIVEDKSRIGDWELDTVIGRQGGSVLVTAVERKTRYSVIALAPNKTAEAVKVAITEALSPFAPYLKTFTYDNGKEFALHSEIADILDVDGYFAHPYHSWERGLNENTNGLIRQYAPKGSSFDSFTTETVEAIMEKLNNRPRKCLDYNTPNQAFFGIKPSIALAT